MARNQLPPQIRKITVRDRKSHKPLIRYQVAVDTGTRTAVEMDPDGVPRTVSKRTQTRRRYKTEQEARTALAATLNSVNDGLYVHTSELNVEMAIEYWLTSKHSLKPSSLHGLERTFVRSFQSSGKFPFRSSQSPTSSPWSRHCERVACRHHRAAHANHGRRALSTTCSDFCLRFSKTR